MSSLGFTRDSAISCAIGHLLGIGDRHLDNILVDINEGKLIHVDFSLVFGRGEKLKVPELVPFRLTQNFSNALQYPGTDGAFMTYMKDFLWTFQNNSELASFCAESIAFASQV
jgi:phosphatidylinositol kinase/protein kinase (PI-3  family)